MRSHIEPLEDRTLLAVMSVFDGAGMLTVTSDADADAITLDVGGAGEVLVNGATVDDGMGGDLLAADVTDLSIDGGDGNDTIDLSAVLAADYSALVNIDVAGGLGEDSIVGSEFDETLDGGIIGAHTHARP